MTDSGPAVPENERPRADLPRRTAYSDRRQDAVVRAIDVVERRSAQRARDDEPRAPIAPHAASPSRHETTEARRAETARSPLQIAHIQSKTPASRPAPAAQGGLGEREREQTIRVSIGRIRVETPAAAAEKRAPFVRPRPKVSIDEYARRRGGTP